MVSLLKLAEIAEEGVKFRSPFDDSECMLTPEASIEIQVNTLNRAIIVALKKYIFQTGIHNKNISNQSSSMQLLNCRSNIINP